VVDSVNEVVRIPPAAVDPRPAGSDHMLSNCIPGVCTEDDKVFILVDIEKVLADDAFYAEANY